MARLITLLLLLLITVDEVWADTAFVGGVVYTMDSDMPRAEMVITRDDRIIFVGSASDGQKLIDDGTAVIDCQGFAVIPGLVDAHAHIMNLGKFLVQVNVVATTSAQQCREAVIERQKDVVAGEWIQGRGWDQNDWQVQEFPTAGQLSGTEANPVYLRRVDGHAGWLNRAALEVTGITRDTPDPPGGRIVRDANGEPTGVVIDAADDAVRDMIPEPGRDEQERRIRLALAACRRNGLTGVHDAGTREAHLDIYREMAANGELDFRLYCMLDTDQAEFTRREMKNGPWTDDSGMITVRAIKLYADGALGSRGAVLLEPYADDPGNSGLLQNPRDIIEEWVRSASQRGYQPCIHAIGDGGNRMVLDVYEDVLSAAPAGDRRFRIEHAQVVAPADIARFAELGVVAAMQPTHATSDMYWAEKRVGSERIVGAYAWRTMLDNGVVIACGSDFPVENVNPMWGVYAAITRQDVEGWPADGWYPAQRLTLDEALYGFTMGAAIASFKETTHGSIEVGKRADITVLDVDPYILDALEVREAQAAYTMVAGQIVYPERRGVK